MNADPDRELREVLTDSCRHLVGQQDVNVVRTRDGEIVDARTVGCGEVAALVQYLMEDKAEEEQVLLAPVGELLDVDSWKVRFPPHMKAEYRKGRASVRRRRMAEFARLDNGFTLKIEARSGFLYYRESEHMLEMAVELGPPDVDFLIQWSGLRKWVFPLESTIDDDERVSLRQKLEDWLARNGYQVNEE